MGYLKTMQGAVLAALVACWPAVAFAATGCEPRYPTPAATQAMFEMAVRLERALDALEGHDTALLARGGQDLSRFGLEHSHLAIATRGAEGTWRVVHLLNRCRTAQSGLYREGLANFVGESALRSDVRVAVFDAALSRRLRQSLLPPASRALSLHEPRYSMVAYPFGTEYQNSNQWVLEVVADAAMDPGPGAATDREMVQQWLRREGYAPSRLHLKLHERIGARLFRKHVATTDHPARERIGGNYSVVTVESVFDFLEERSLLERDFSVPHQPVSPATLESAP